MKTFIYRAILIKQKHKVLQPEQADEMKIAFTTTHLMEMSK